MARRPNVMRKLTLMGAKHLLKGGHISKTTHRKMVKSVKAKAAKLPKMEPQMDPELGLPEAEQAPLQFGSLDPAMLAPPAPPTAPSPAMGPLGGIAPSPLGQPPQEDPLMGMLGGLGGGFLR